MNKESKAIAKYAIQLAEHASRTLTESIKILLSILEEAEESSNDELSEASKGEQVVKDLPFGFKRGQAETIPAGTFHKEQEGLNLMVDFSKGNPLYNKDRKSNV